MPLASIAGLPKRCSSQPEKNDGAYMPTRCHSMICAPCLIVCWHATAAIGVAVITNIITALPMPLLANAARKSGWRTISPSGRAGRPSLAALPAASEAGSR
ncbi:hypothetical protein D3C85_1397330 [compost metagenome]